MLRSMYSSITGLRNFQTKLDVIGNNIANVNTHGFKKSRVVFKDLISQTQSGATGPTLGGGGINAKQVGLGSQSAAIDTIHGTGALQTTGRTLDIGMEGEGYFVVGKVGEPTGGAEAVVTNYKSVSYTRAGNFYMDEQGFLVNSNGDYLVGWMGEDGELPDNAPDGDEIIGHIPMDEAFDEVTAKWPFEEVGADTQLFPYGGGEEIAGGRIWIPTNAQSMSIGADGTVSYVDSAGALQFAGQLMIAKFSNAEGLAKEGNNYYQSSANSGVPNFGSGGSLGIGKTVSGALEMSNVDLSEEFTEMIVAQRGFQANSRIITTSDEILQELVNLKR